MSSLYDKYGGIPVISKIVHNFYGKILKSQDLKKFFENVNIENLMNHQIQLFSHVMGGPTQYDLTRLKNAHSRMDIKGENFAEVAEILEETLEDAGVEDEDIKTIMGIVGSTRSEIVGAV
ncbi:MAG: group 1 truncated hemoglobin [Leptospiraceae bacterium]|nr:group 1 truncated hemoglobin [Leptospiraceae bacterium]